MRDIERHPRPTRLSPLGPPLLHEAVPLPYLKVILYLPWHPTPHCSPVAAQSSNLYLVLNHLAHTRGFSACTSLLRRVGPPTPNDVKVLSVREDTHKAGKKIVWFSNLPNSFCPLAFKGCFAAVAFPFARLNDMSKIYVLMYTYIFYYAGAYSSKLGFTTWQ